MVDVKLHLGDALEVLKTMPSESVDCCISSPPYWNLRDYGIKEQLGLEKTFDEYILKLCNIFDEVKRVLKKTGTCWVNLGDTYSGSMCGAGDTTSTNRNKPESYKEKYRGQKAGKTYLPDKCLCMIPYRFAIEMVNCGWMLRNTIIWHKRNCMPSSVKDRFTIDFEYVFFFVKNKKYFFETQYEKYDKPLDRWGGNELKADGKAEKDLQGMYRNRNMRPNELGRNRRCVWDITTKGFSGVKLVSDYVGQDGKFYKASIDCPIYVHRLLAEKRNKGLNDGLVDFRKSHNQHNGNYLFPELENEFLSATDFHNLDVDKSLAKKNEQMPQNISDYKTSDSSQEKVVFQNHHHNKDNEQKLACKKDYSDPDNSKIAISHNKKKNKRGLVLETNLSYNSSDKNASCIGDKQDIFQSSEGHPDTSESKPSGDCVLNEKGLNPLAQNFSDKQGISYKHYNKAKCTCQEVTVDHFATFPEKLVEPMIKAGCPEFVCKKCGKPRYSIMKPSEEYAKLLKQSWTKDTDKDNNLRLQIGFQANTKKVACTADYKKIGYTDCGCNADFSGGIVLDPFSGAGTTGVVAKKLNRNFIGIDLNPDYIKMSERRIKNTQEPFL